jgi:hypothetical protein
VESHIWRVLCNVSMLFAHAQKCQGQYISNAYSAETKKLHGNENKSKYQNFSENPQGENKPALCTPPQSQLA